LFSSAVQLQQKLAACLIEDIYFFALTLIAVNDIAGAE